MNKILTFLKSQFFVKTLLLLILITLSFTFCFHSLDNQPLATWDEYTNFSVVYETIDSGNFLVLIRDGKPFLEKPPLWYWLTMSSTKIFGINNFSVRSISAVSGVLLILLVFYLGWKMFSYRAGIIAGFTLLATRHLLISHATIFATHNLRSADLDALQILFIMLTTFAFFNITRSIDKKSQYFWLTISAIFTSFAFLTKGPLALLPGIIFFTFQIINSKKKDLKKIFMSLCFYVFIFLITIVPWHLYMTLRFGNDFISEYFGYHILQRGFTTIEGHNGDLLYYIKLLFHKDFFFSGEILFMAIAYIFGGATRTEVRGSKLLRLPAKAWRQAGRAPCLPKCFRHAGREPSEATPDFAKASSGYPHFFLIPGFAMATPGELPKAKALGFLESHHPLGVAKEGDYKQKITRSFSSFYCFIASLSILLIITLAQTKLSWYLLPLYPYAGLLIGKFFHDLSKSQNKLIKTAAILIILFTLTSQIGFNLIAIFNTQHS